MAKKQIVSKTEEVPPAVMANGSGPQENSIADQIRILQEQVQSYLTQFENAKTMYLKTLGALEMLQGIAANNQK
jgi:hypothetical protein